MGINKDNVLLNDRNITKPLLYKKNHVFFIICFGINNKTSFTVKVNCFRKMLSFQYQ